MTDANTQQTHEDFDQLIGWEETDHTELTAGQHFRYTVDKYKQPGVRKCVYAIVDKVSKDKTAFSIGGYKSDPLERWTLDTTNQWKTYRFYIKTSEDRVIDWE